MSLFYSCHFLGDEPLQSISPTTDSIFLRATWDEIHSNRENENEYVYTDVWRSNREEKKFIMSNGRLQKSQMGIEFDIYEWGEIKFFIHEILQKMV